MKKIMFSLIFAIGILAVSVSAKTVEFKMGDYEVNVREDGSISTETIETAPYTLNDRTMLPVRIIMENFDANVAWDEAEKKVTVTKGDTVIILVVGSDIAYVNGEQVKLDVTPVEINGRTMVPVRFISENLGYDVNYIEATEHVVVTDSPAVAEVNGKKVNSEFYEFLYDLYKDSQLATYPDDYIAEYVLNACYEYYALSDEAASKGFVNTADENVAIKEEVASIYADLGDFCLESTLAEYYTRTMLIAKYQQLVAQISVTEDIDVEAFYNENYMAAKHILIADKSEKGLKEAKEIKAKLSRGADFDNLMEKYSQDTGLDANPDGYVFTSGEMVAEFENAVKELKVGKVSDVVESEYGYHIIMRIKLPELDEEDRSEVLAEITFVNMLNYLSGIVKDAECVSNYTTSELVEMYK